MSRGSLPPVEDDFSRALLGSAEADGPSHAAYAKAATALGVGVGLGVGASLPAAAALGAAGATGVARWSSLLGAKLLLLGVSGTLLVGAGALFLHHSPTAKAMIQTGAQHAAQAASAAAANQRAPSVDSPLAPSVPPAVVSAPPSVARAVTLPGTSSMRMKSAGQGSASVALHPLPVLPSARRAPTQEPRDSSLAEQVQSLDRARVALTTGDSSSALAEIARYRATWPTGVFLTEASVLEIEALAARGERSLAQARAVDFVTAHPDSPQADRLRALIPRKKR
jgi:hypothetical protein